MPLLLLHSGCTLQLYEVKGGVTTSNNLRTYSHLRLIQSSRFAKVCLYLKCARKMGNLERTRTCKNYPHPTDNLLAVKGTVHRSITPLITSINQSIKFICISLDNNQKVPKMPFNKILKQYIKNNK